MLFFFFVTFSIVCVYYQRIFSIFVFHKRLKIKRLFIDLIAKLMDFFQYLKVLTFLLVLPTCAHAQIETGKADGGKLSKPKKAKRAIQEKTVIDNPNTILYFGGGLGMAFRDLKENEGLFGKPLGERANETNSIVPSFTLGVKTNLKNNFFLDLGISYAMSGEKYRYEFQDSTYNYKSTYSYFAIPIKVQYIAGNKWKFIAGIGIQPQIFTGFKKEITWNDINGKPRENTIKKDDINFFSIAALANVGVSWQFRKNTSVFVIPEVRYDLSNTYLKQAPYVRKGFFIGGQIGLSMAIN